MDRYYTANTVGKIFFSLYNLWNLRPIDFDSDKDSIKQILRIKCAKYFNVIIDVLTI